MSNAVLGVLLAGGLARRFGGGDKCLLKLDGKTLLQHVLERVGVQVDRLILNANGDPERFSDYGLDVVADVVDGYAGPLAGILTALEWARDHAPQSIWVASFPTDAPMLPFDLVERMLQAVAEQGADMACAQSGGRTHPVIALWPVSIIDDLRTALVDQDIHKIGLYTSRYHIAHVDFTAADGDPFLNINTPDDLDGAEKLLSK
jgi:molybdopterin-guanine dinucleotide biosynthesis protein A